MFGLNAVIERAIQKDPAERFQSATDFADALREIVAYRTGDRATSDRRSWVRAAYRACSQCGNLNPPASRFCGECGEVVARDSIQQGFPAFQPSKGTGPRAPERRMSPEERRAATVDAMTAQRVAAEAQPQGALQHEAGPGRSNSPTEKPALQESAPPPIRRAAPQIQSDNKVAPSARESKPSAAAPPNGSASREDTSSDKARTDNARASQPVLDRGLEAAIAEAEGDDDPNTALLFLEQLAQNRMKAGDPRGAAVVLQRGISIARADLDRGQLDDPIHVVAIFSAKLGEAYLETGDFMSAHVVLKDALALSRAGKARARVWLLLSRVARAQGHDQEATEFLEAADREAESSRRRSHSQSQRFEAASDSPRRRR